MYSLKNNEQRARLAIIFLIIQIILLATNELSNFLELQFYVNSEEGYAVDMDRFDILTGFQAIFGLFYIIIFIVTIIFFIMWFRRAYYNLAQIVRTERADGWAAGAWFIPFYNLVKPKQIMDELYNKTNLILKERMSNYEKRSLEIVTIWWILWIVSNIAFNISSKMYIRAETASDFISSIQLSLVTDFLAIIPAILAILVIKRYSKMEELLLAVKMPESETKSQMTTVLTS